MSLDKKGRKSIVKKHPNILRFTKEFIELHIDPEAESRRKNSVQYCRGFSGKELRDYILKRHLECQSATEQLNMSIKTVKRLFNPPNKSFNSAEYYKGIFDIKKCGGNLLQNILCFNIL